MKNKLFGMLFGMFILFAFSFVSEAVANCLEITYQYKTIEVNTRTDQRASRGSRIERESKCPSHTKFLGGKCLFRIGSQSPTIHFETRKSKPKDNGWICVATMGGTGSDPVKVIATAYCSHRQIESEETITPRSTNPTAPVARRCSKKVYQHKTIEVNTRTDQRASHGDRIERKSKCPSSTRFLGGKCLFTIGSQNPTVHFTNRESEPEDNAWKCVATIGGTGSDPVKMIATASCSYRQIKSERKRQSPR